MIKDIIVTKDKECGDYFCEITSDMNEHLKSCWKSAVKKGYTWGTYIYDISIGKNYCAHTIRFPGATRGHLLTDENNIITDIIFYQSSCYGKEVGCYEDTLDVEVFKKKYVGCRLVYDESKVYNGTHS